MFKSLIIRKITLPCSILLFALTAFGEIGFDQWTTEDGLPHNTVRKIVQTPDGYLWMMTFDGLARFDGVRFVTFNTVNTKEITDNRFYDGFVDRDGTLWLSTLNDTVLRFRNGKFEAFTKIKEFSQREDVIFGTDKNGELIFRTDSGWRYFGNGEFPLIPEELQPRNVLNCKGKTGKIWTFKADGVTENFQGKTTKYPISFDTIRQNRCSGFER